MKENKFNEIVKEILIPVIDDMAEAASNPVGDEIGKEFKEIIEESKKNILDDYNISKEDFKKKFMKGGNENSVIDRHKVAALFYVNFVDFVKKNYRANDIDDLLKDLFLHNVAFNAAVAIIESFICANNKESAGFRLHVKDKGIVGKIDRYRDYTIKELVFAHNENKLSVFLLANIFYSIERNSKAEYGQSF